MVGKRCPLRRAGNGRYGRREVQKGDHVTWKSHGGTAEGTVEKKITEDTEAAGRTVRASEDDPQYLVQAARSPARTPCTSRAH